MDLILYYLSCLSGVKLTLYLARRTRTQVRFGAEVLSAENTPEEGKKKSEFLNF